MGLVIQAQLGEFMDQVSSGNIEIYNEYSIQFELAIFLRANLPIEYKIQLERNISYFGLDKENFLKKEMDIVVFNPDKKERHCIEIKNPTNGQFPEQMFSICKDIKFLEELVDAGFSDSYCLVVANNPLFYNNNGDEGIYRLFRKEKLLKGTIQKPTGKKDITYQLNNKYKIEWKDLSGTEKYFITTVIGK
ncbi:hypothetical protein BTO30_00550 [Domibacillus antri]|uniref:Uncharacterized protein n=1 Tax=Domibacillus antri TaxID=1714264 RepID=A0A1Q8Q9D3_9BACI|nr:hypothetical protein [Domibacillus antri]OLN23953.1 hypothetical protein BTO30_00550 [Domibacillus antri]